MNVQDYQDHWDWARHETVDKPRESRERIARKYIQSILPHEISVLKSSTEDKPRWPDSVREKFGATVLVALVGHTFEPLCQALCAWRPEKLVLLSSPKYGDEDGESFVSNSVKPVVDQLTASDVWSAESTASRGLDYSHESIDAHESLTGGVFKALVNIASEEARGLKRTLLVDITGGKKSMVAGAFLFAALADVKITYVDFDRYDPAYGRPYGTSARIGLIENPYQSLQISAWGRCEESYERWAFEQVAGMVAEIRTALLGALGENHDNHEPLRLLERVLRYLHAWSGADYSAAWSAFSEIHSVAGVETKHFYRESVETLSEIWTADLRAKAKPGSIGVMKREIAAAFFAKPDRVELHARDELLRVEALRTRRRDYRNAFFRAVALAEGILKAIGCKVLEADIDTVCNDLSFKVLIDRVVGAEASTRTAYDVMWPSEACDSLHRHREIRNQVVHASMPITAEQAEVAQDLAAQCYTALQTLVEIDPSPNTDNGVGASSFPPDWPALVRACNVRLPIPPMAQESATS